MTQHLSSDPENIEIGEGAQLVHARDSSHILFSLFLMLAGLIMRAPIVVLPIYIEPMAEHMHRDVGSFGIITSLPLVMFVVVSLLVPWLVQKINLTRTFQVASVFIFVGSMLRGVLTWNTMLAGTVLVGIGIAILNIGMPTLVSEKFSQQPGLYTMRYCAAIVVGAIVLVLLSPFVSATIGWQTMLWVMAAMTACPMLLSFFLPQLTVETPEATDSENKGMHNSVIDLSLLRDVRIWLFIGMFAGQSFLSYTMSAWLPSILNADDVQSVHNTIIMLIFNAIGLPISVGIPFFVARTSRRYHIIAVTALTALQVGVAALFPLHSVLGISYWYVFATVTCAFFTTIFVMVLTFYPIKAATAADAAEISGMSQSVGYLIAATGPVLYGWMYGDAMPGVSFVFAMILVVVINAWCSWHVIRMNVFSVRNTQEKH